MRAVASRISGSRSSRTGSNATSPLDAMPELVAELEQLVEENPLRERLQGQLMRALYGTGRQGDALDVYRRARRTLSEELGLEPGPQLQELERKILNQDPELAPATRSPRTRVRSRPTVRRVNRRIALLALLGVLLLSAAIAGIVRATGGGATARSSRRRTLWRSSIRTAIVSSR